MNIRQSTEAYEGWLREQLDGAIVEKDLRKKHEKMCADAFQFLRATYWRWAETILDVCSNLADAPKTLSVGDIHLENYGVWRDEDGRLVWGVNDFDEAAEMPYVLDLVRLATSAALAQDARSGGIMRICSSILDGYRDGLKDPRAFVLDGAHQFLRKQFDVSKKERANFWDDIEQNRAKAPKKPPDGMRRVLEHAMPKGFEHMQFWPRSAGTGSLGRPRWVGYAEWCGAPVIREVKAVVASGWSRLPGRGSTTVRCAEIATGSYRAPDPWYALRRQTVVRRLSPNSRKLELGNHGEALLHPKMLSAMGRDLANVHLGTAGRGKAIARDLDNRPRGWLGAWAEAAAEFVRREHREWKQT